MDEVVFNLPSMAFSHPHSVDEMLQDGEVATGSDKCFDIPKDPKIYAEIEYGTMVLYSPIKWIPCGVRVQSTSGIWRTDQTVTVEEFYNKPQVGNVN